MTTSNSTSVKPANRRSDDMTISLPRATTGSSLVTQNAATQSPGLTKAEPGRHAAANQVVNKLDPKRMDRPTADSQSGGTSKLSLRPVSSKSLRHQPLFQPIYCRMQYL
jgi:hypothetical protein